MHSTLDSIYYQISYKQNLNIYVRSEDFDNFRHYWHLCYKLQLSHNTILVNLLHIPGSTTIND